MYSDYFFLETRTFYKWYSIFKRLLIGDGNNEGKLLLFFLYLQKCSSLCFHSTKENLKSKRLKSTIAIKVNKRLLFQISINYRRKRLRYLVKVNEKGVYLYLGTYIFISHSKSFKM